MEMKARKIADLLKLLANEHRLLIYLHPEHYCFSTVSAFKSTENGWDS